MTRKTGYIERWLQRQRQRAQTDRSAFGVIGGASLFSYFGFRFLYVIGGPDALWLVLSMLGAMLLFLGLFGPDRLAFVDEKYRSLASLIGNFIFTVILSLVYFVLIVPVGILVRRIRGSVPFYAWSEVPGEEMEGWTEKVIDIDEDALARVRKSSSLITQPFLVFSYFMRYQHYILLPALVILITVGLLMFFVATSTLAPFIYTLF